MPFITLQSPTGPLTIFEEAGEIIVVEWGRASDSTETPLLLKAKQQLEEYFAGEREVFDLPLRPEGTDFQQAVWQKMLAIPYGEIKTYGDLAKSLGSHARAVGGACGRNPPRKLWSISLKATKESKFFLTMILSYNMKEARRVYRRAIKRGDLIRDHDEQLARHILRRASNM